MIAARFLSRQRRDVPMSRQRYMFVRSVYWVCALAWLACVCWLYMTWDNGSLTRWAIAFLLFLTTPDIIGLFESYETYLSWRTASVKGSASN